MPLQLGGSDDQPEHGIVHRGLAEEGDVLVVASDGVWDNLFPHEVVQLIVDEEVKGHGDAGAMARAIADASFRVASTDTTSKKTPFAKAAAKFGVPYVGGKLDDITVVVGIVSMMDEDMTFLRC
eukprot:PhM_4_TR5560/c0_g1_i1/m.56872/K17508/PTC7, PPTC7; protein phosphatase PTC7